MTFHLRHAVVITVRFGTLLAWQCLTHKSTAYCDLPIRNIIQEETASTTLYYAWDTNFKNIITVL